MTHLLDSDLLIARIDASHVHHSAAVRWLHHQPEFAVCPITEGALVRYLYRAMALHSQAILEILNELSKAEGYQFWPATISYRRVDYGRIQGYRQTTDAYLVALAKSYGGQLATFDQGLAATHPEALLVDSLEIPD